MTRTTTVRKSDAEKVLAAVRNTYSAYVEPGYGPTLVENYRWSETSPAAPYAIVWEEGSPYEWTYNFPGGGFDEEMYFLAREFGEDVARRLATKAPTELPDTVFVEPIYSFVLGIYPA